MKRRSQKLCEQCSSARGKFSESPGLTIPRKETEIIGYVRLRMYSKVLYRIQHSTHTMDIFILVPHVKVPASLKPKQQKCIIVYAVGENEF